MIATAGGQPLALDIEGDRMHVLAVRECLLPSIPVDAANARFAIPGTACKMATTGRERHIMYGAGTVSGRVARTPTTPQART